MECKAVLESEKDKHVLVEGWIRKHRKFKDMGFIEISDGTTLEYLQIVYTSDLSDFGSVQKIPFGSSIEVSGTTKISDTGLLEIRADKIKVIGICTEDYPIQPKKHSKEFLRSEAYLRPRTKMFQAVFRVRSIASMAVHEFFFKEGFLYLHAPLITASDCEGSGDMFQVTILDLDKIASLGKVDYEKEYFGKKTGLSVSAQLEGEAFAQCFRKIYTFGPSFRADPSHTPYHLGEFWQIEPEVAFCDLEGIMDLSEKLFKYIIKYVLKHAPREMELLDSLSPGLIDKLKGVIKSDFVRVTYKECIDILLQSKDKFEFEVEYGKDIAKEHEKYLTKYFDKPIFITYWPKELKCFYMKQLPDGTVAAADMELPGIGEVYGMSQREDDYDALLARIKDLGMKLDDYTWYLKLRKYGSCPRAGFGIGFERLLMYITGMDSIKDVIPFPRYSKSCEY